MRKQLVWLIATAIVIAVLAAFGTARRDEAQYLTASVERGDVRDAVEATGTINAVTTVLVGSQISGRVAKLSADFNSVVRKGQIIAEIDPALMQGALLQASADLKNAEANVSAMHANLEKAKAALVQAKADYERALILAKQDSIALQALDQSKGAYDSAVATVASCVAAIKQAEAQVRQREAALSVARTNLEYTIIRSPIDGTVVARNVELGQTVAASLQAPTLFTIAQDLAKMQVYTKIDESNVGRVKLGRAVTFKVDAFPKDTFTGVVSQVRMNPTTIQNVVTYDTLVDFDNPEHKLFPGMTAYVTIPVASSENVLKIPNGALRYAPQGAKSATRDAPKNAGAAPTRLGVVWKLRSDGGTEPVEVSLGITDHSYTAVLQIVSGQLREGDSLVTGVVPSNSEVPAKSISGASLKK